MSRGYNARRKAKRQQAQAAARPTPSRRSPQLRRRLVALLPVLAIVGIFATVGVLGFGASNGVGKKQIEQEVTELLDGIPQKGRVLGSPRAPITLWVYADLQCPTVKIYVEKYLPSIIESWVRAGAVKLEYGSLQTDTLDEGVFFDQETAALAAGRQDRMWNFLLTFVRQQGEVRTDYVNEEFLTGIASQVPDLKMKQWRNGRNDPLLSKRVAVGVYRGHREGLRATPSFLIGYSSGRINQRIDLRDKASIKKEIEVSMKQIVLVLREEAFRDSPEIKTIEP